MRDEDGVCTLVLDLLPGRTVLCLDVLWYRQRCGLLALALLRHVIAAITPARNSATAFSTAAVMAAASSYAASEPARISAARAA